MLFWTIVKVGLKSLWANKLRSFLAMLGIIIGVGAVIAMLALGAGMRVTMMARMSAMGTNLLIVRPGQTHGHGVASDTSQKLTVADAEAIVREVENVMRGAPVVSQSAQVKFRSRNSRVTINGVSASWLGVRAYEIDRGRAFTQVETDGMHRVAVVGPKTASDLFGDEDPLGQSIKIKGINFVVVGVTKVKGDQGFFNADDQVIVPYTTAMQQLMGVDYLREIDVQAEDGSDLKKVQDDITALLRKKHRIIGDSPNDFEVRNQADWIQVASDQNRYITVFLGCVAGISLLVGGIGIMNIMLVSVTERTREIGIRKAIGARQRSIMTQFLLEAVFVSGLGGLIGVALGMGASSALGGFKIVPFEAVVEAYTVLLSMGFSAAVGVFFGFYPAWRAAKLDPVEALRYE